MSERTMTRSLDWLGLVIEPLPAPSSPASCMINPDDHQSYHRGCNFTRKMGLTDNNTTGRFSHLYHSNKKDTSVYLLNTLIDMVINLSEKFKTEFSNTRFTQKLKEIKEILRALEHIISQNDQGQINQRLTQLKEENEAITKRLDQIMKHLVKLPTKQDIMEFTQLPKKVEEQTLQAIAQISTDADNRLEEIKKLIEKFHNEWLG